MSFEKPVGAVADVREIEYISALHQVGDDGIRVDGSIRGTYGTVLFCFLFEFCVCVCVCVCGCLLFFPLSHITLFLCVMYTKIHFFHNKTKQNNILYTQTDADISAFLCSRYGIIVTAEEVRKVILNGLGGVVTVTTIPEGEKNLGGESSEQQEENKDVVVVPGSPYSSIDLMKVVALLFIPTILKAADAEVGNITISKKKKKRLEEDDGNEDDDDDIHDSSVVMVPPPSNLLQSILNMILKDVSFCFQKLEALQIRVTLRYVPFVVLDSFSLSLSLSLYVSHSLTLHTTKTKVTGYATPRRLDRALLKSIFEHYGEMELADDDDALDDMIDAATSKSSIAQGGVGQANELLDLNVFVHGLTHDITLYDIDGEIHKTTIYEDVMLDEDDNEAMIIINTKDKKKLQKQQQRQQQQHQEGPMDMEGDSNGNGGENEHEKERTLEKKFTGPSMDSATGAYRSKALNVFLWVACT